MKTDKLLLKLNETLGFTPKAKDFARILDFANEQSFYSRVKRNSDFSDEEVELIEKHYGISLRGNTIEETVSVDYYPEVFGSCGDGKFVVSEQKELIQVPKKVTPSHT